ncbi:MAG: NAD-dependent epimerase/dehydratase family protein [Crinalium sp.]
MKSILITGATGFIASHLMPLLIKHGWCISAAIRSNSNQIPTDVTPVSIGDINSSTSWHHALKDIDILIHLAARAHILQDKASNPEAEFFKVNTEGTANLVKQAIQAGVKHFVFISSIGAMTTLSDRPLTENSPCQPDTPYGRSKLQAEQALISLAKQSNMTWTILRPTLVYGSGNPGNMERLIKLVNRGFPLPFARVKNRRSFIFVGNLVDAIATCLTHPQAANQIFLVSDGEDVSTPELVSKIALQIQKPCNLLPVPTSLLKFTGYLGDKLEYLTKKPLPLNTATVDRLLGSLFIDSNHIQNTLNWQPPFTIEQGLFQTLRP